MAGYPMQKGTEYYQKAADKAKEVLEAKWYSLFNNFDYLHDDAHKNQGELILQSQFEKGIITNSISQMILPFHISDITVYPDTYGAIMPSQAFYNSYEAGDLRTQEQQFYFSKYPSLDGSRIVEFGQQALYKYFHKESAFTDGECDENWTLMRLPEVMLIYAEASNEVTGPVTDAYSAVNAIRQRAQLFPLSGLTKDQFRIAIWKERYHELCYEDKAYFDIQRTHKYYDVANNTFVDVIGYRDEDNVVWSEKYLLWGIPQTEIDANKNLTQNKGW